MVMHFEEQDPDLHFPTGTCPGAFPLFYPTFRFNIFLFSVPAFKVYVDLSFI